MIYAPAMAQDTLRLDQHVYQGGPKTSIPHAARQMTSASEAFAIAGVDESVHGGHEAHEQRPAAPLDHHLLAFHEERTDLPGGQPEEDLPPGSWAHLLSVAPHLLNVWMRRD